MHKEAVALRGEILKIDHALQSLSLANVAGATPERLVDLDLQRLRLQRRREGLMQAYAVALSAALAQPEPEDNQ
jgi:hypothetical protein